MARMATAFMLSLCLAASATDVTRLGNAPSGGRYNHTSLIRACSDPDNSVLRCTCDRLREEKGFDVPLCCTTQHFVDARACYRELFNGSMWEQAANDASVVYASCQRVSTETCQVADGLRAWHEDQQALAARVLASMTYTEQTAKRFRANVEASTAALQQVVNERVDTRALASASKNELEALRRSVAEQSIMLNHTLHAVGYLGHMTSALGHNVSVVDDRVSRLSNLTADGIIGLNATIHNSTDVLNETISTGMDKLLPIVMRLESLFDETRRDIELARKDMADLSTKFSATDKVVTWLLSMGLSQLVLFVVVILCTFALLWRIIDKFMDLCCKRRVKRARKAVPVTPVVAQKQVDAPVQPGAPSAPVSVEPAPPRRVRAKLAAAVVVAAPRRSVRHKARVRGPLYVD